MRTIQDFLIQSIELLQKNNIANPKQQAEYLLSDLLSISISALYANSKRLLTAEEECEGEIRLAKRVKGIPLQYIHGWVDFYDCRIQVTPDVLIPRPETEILVDRIVESLKGESLAGKILLDLCCGSGCIGIALKKRFPDLEVILSDLSEKALAVAAENGRINGVSIECLHGDLLAPFVKMGKKAHFIVCNPPYISEKDYANLDREVKDFEPRTALVGGPLGTEIYTRLANEMPNALLTGAKIWLEIGYDQGHEIQRLFDNKEWQMQRVEKDWAGHDRFFLATKG